MTQRPAISRDIQRDVLFEARHRCAVCCWPLTLELAHIVPWCETQDHSLPNLIALCPNCHSLADKERWGAPYLRRYKEKPCALSQHLERPMTTSQRVLVEVILSNEPESMTDRERARLLSMLAAYLDINLKDVELISVQRTNSSRVILQMPREAATRLVSAFVSRDPRLNEFMEAFELRGVLALSMLPPIFDMVRQTLPREFEKRFPTVEAKAPFRGNTGTMPLVEAPVRKKFELIGKSSRVVVDVEAAPNQHINYHFHWVGAPRSDLIAVLEAQVILTRKGRPHNIVRKVVSYSDGRVYPAPIGHNRFGGDQVSQLRLNKWVLDGVDDYTFSGQILERSQSIL